MSFSPSILAKKLSSLQETQDSIVTISQWVLFHQRHSKEAASTWAKYITEDPDARSSKKKLSLLYLCNDVVQQARHKRKQEFIDEFAAVLPGVLKKIYASLDPPIQPKVDRLIAVWEQRHVFSASVISDLREGVKNASSAAAPNAPTSASTPTGPTINSVPDLRLLTETYLHLNKLVDISSETLSRVGMLSKTYLSPTSSESLPAPREYISKLNQLEQLCNSSTTSIEELKKVRLDAIKQLDSLRANINDSLQGDEEKLKIIQKKLASLKETRSELYDMIEGENDIQPSGLVSEAEAEPEALPLDDDDEVPTYQNDNDSDEENPPKRQKTSNSFHDSKSPSEKKVAFSDNIEIKEFRSEDESRGISIIPSVEDTDDDNIYDTEEVTSISSEFTKHHKDDLELKYEHESTDDDGYNPSSGVESDYETNVNPSVLNLLSKLA
ncbi:hypothetical protein JA9_004391 [Meyerozyma sp. JA9]|nr:hypothetical protein JA9_004391 [Meyerozyma sp. JA9]